MEGAMRLTVVVLVLAMAVSAAAQVSRPSVSVRIITEDGSTYSAPVRIELTNESGMIVAEAFSRDGMAQFPPIAPGRYRLRVSSPDIEAVNTPPFYVVEYDKQVQMVRVKLLNSGQGGSTQGTVSSHEVNVPEKAQAERRKGGEAIARSEWKKAIEHLDKAIAIDPKYASAYNDIGYAYLKSGDMAKARESFQKAVELEEHTGRALLNLARFVAGEKNFPEAIRLANKAIALAPGNAEALLLLANCEYVTEQYTLAVTHARKVHDLPHERLAVAHYIAAMALEADQKTADAILEYNTFLKEDPKNSKAATAREAVTRLSAQAQPAAAPNPKP
jgi:Flp pilus assembly protein TadD